MPITPASVYASIPESFRLNLLKCLWLHVGTEASTPKAYDTLKFSALDKQRLDEALEKISVVGAEQNAGLVHNLLSENGWTHDDFSKSESGRARACALFCLNSDDFEYVISHYNTTRLIGRVKQEAGFRLPITDLQFDFPLDGSALSHDHHLYQRLRGVLQNHFGGKELIAVRPQRRRTFGNDTSMVIQVSLSFGDDPIEVDLNVDGEEQKQSLSFLSRAVILIDMDRKRLFVGSDDNRKSLREDIAGAFLDEVTTEDVPLSNLHPVKVYPARLKAQPSFRPVLPDGISEIYVSSLSFRRYGTSRNYRQTVTVDTNTPSLYEHPDIKRDPDSLRIYRGEIAFLFKSRISGKEPVKRVVSLNGDKGISYGNAFPDQRVIMDRILTDAELLDATDTPDTRAELSDLRRFIIPQFLAEARLSIGEELVDGLLTHGFLERDADETRYWCEACGKSHEIRQVWEDTGLVLKVQCSNCNAVITADSLQTVVLSIGKVLKVVMEALDVDQIGPKRVTNGAWYLGKATPKGRGSKFDVIVMADHGDPHSKSVVFDYGADTLTGEKILVLTLANIYSTMSRHPRWHLMELSPLLRVSPEDYEVDIDPIYRVLSGKPPSKTQAKNSDWETFLKRFDATCTNEGHYTEAARMLRDYPDDCPAGKDQLAKVLKRERPHLFS